MENKEHIKKVYTEKAINLLKVSLGLGIFSLCTYIVGIFLYQSFDFGCIFEIISFVFVLLAYLNVQKNNWQSSKRNVIIAMLPLGWLLVYDFIHLLVHLNEVLPEIVGYYMSFDQYFYYLGPYLFDFTLIDSLLLLYKTYSSLCIADGTRKDNSFVDTFYDTL